MYYKKFYALDGQTPVPAVIRSYTEADFTELITIQSEAFPPPYPAELWWNREQLLNHVTLFPEGALCVEVAGELAGSVTGFLMNFDPEAPMHHHTWSEVTADGYLTSHQPDGNTLYIADLCVRPKYRKLGLGQGTGPVVIPCRRGTEAGAAARSGPDAGLSQGGRSDDSGRVSGRGGRRKLV